MNIQLESIKVNMNQWNTINRIIKTAILEAKHNSKAGYPTHITIYNPCSCNYINMLLEFEVSSESYSIHENGKTIIPV